VSRVLVAYGTKYGSTAEIAERIGETLRREGHDSVVAPARDVRDIEGYDAVVLGSAVYIRRWRRDAKRLLERLRRDRCDRPLWLFSSGPLGDDKPDPSDKWQHPKKVRELGERLGARDHVVFGGRVPLHPGSFMERRMLKDMPEDKRDARDFEAIAAWARHRTLATRLTPNSIATTGTQRGAPPGRGWGALGPSRRAPVRPDRAASGSATRCRAATRRRR
jgi:menaquinone-dependent protoporphyrinogen oxidase